MARILIYESRAPRDDFSGSLAGEGHEIVMCRDREDLFVRLAERRPDALVYVLCDLLGDLAVLVLIRRVAPRLPIILLGGPASLEARRSVQDLKPTYYGVFPLDPAELGDAIHGALATHHGRSVMP